MSIRTRLMFTLGILLLAAAVALSFVTRTYSLPELLAWENKEALAQHERFRQALAREIEHLRIYNREWAVWDDTYQFVLDGNEDFIASNLQESTFVGAHINLMTYYRNDGQVTWTGFYTGAGIDTNLGAEIAERFKDRALEALHGEPLPAGVVLTQAGMLLVSMHPLLTSLEKGPPHGVLVVGRIIDSAFLDQLRTQTELDLDLAPATELQRLAGPAGVPTALDAGGAPLVRILSPGLLQVLARYPDIYGKYVLALRIELPRAVFVQGQRLIRFSLYGTVSVLIGALIVAWLVLQRLVFTPIAELAEHTVGIHQSGDYTRRINSRRGDEFGRLAQAFDALLGRIDAQAQELTRMSFEDGLTGLKNRRYFNEHLGSAWSMMERTRQPLSVLMFDVDEFKRYNDHYGHQLGDMALQMVARTAGEVLRRSADVVARYGGEEFVAVLPGMMQQEAGVMAERLRQAIVDLDLPHAASTVAEVVTISIGVAGVLPAPGKSVRDLMQQADTALYTAKRTGRNRVACAPEIQPDA